MANAPRRVRPRTSAASRSDTANLSPPPSFGHAPGLPQTPTAATWCASSSYLSRETIPYARRTQPSAAP